MIFYKILIQFRMIRLLFEAVRIGERIENVKKILVESFKDIHDLLDQYGNSLLHVATDKLSQQYPDAFNDENKKRFVNLKNNAGFTAFHYAIFRHEGKIISLLEQNGADIYMISQDGLNSLHFAAQGGSPLLIYYFIGKGFKLSSIDSKGNTALHWAVYAGMENAVSALLAWGAEKDVQQDNTGMTPLHYAVFTDNVRVVKKLLLFGCDRTIKNKKGKFPYDLAIEKGYTDMASVIKDQTGILQLLNIRPRYRLMEKRTFPFYFFTLTFFICYFINFAYIFPASELSQDYLTLVNFGIGFFLVFLYFVLAFSDPGILQPKQNGNLLFLLKTYNSGQICYFCNILKPARSRHCTICHRCVSVYDHHCPWIANCVGSNNYLRFFGFVLFLSIYLLYNIVYHTIKLIYIFQYHIGSFEVIKIIASVINLLIGLMFIIPVIYLLYTHGKNAVSNKTTFEKYSKVSQKEPIRKVNHLKKRRRTTLVSSIHSRQESGQRTQKEDSLFNKESMQFEQEEELKSKKISKAQNCLKMLCYNNRNEAYKMVD